MFISHATLLRHNSSRANPDTFARIYPDGVNLTLGVCLYHAHRFTWGEPARALIRPELAREYRDALAFAQADYAATVADAGYTASSVTARNLSGVEAMLLADRAYRRALAPAKQGYSRAWAVAWFDNVLPELIERSQTNG
jgi:hypothetical protein